MMAMMMVVTITANAMSYNAAKNEALFLSDKMAYELNLSAAQYEAVYEINIDYLMSLNKHSNAYGIWWDRRNTDLRHVMTSRQYNKYVTMNHFYRPVAWKTGGWTFAVYSHYKRGHLYNAHPKAFTSYRGGHNKVNGSYYAHNSNTKSSNITSHDLEKNNTTSRNKGNSNLENRNIEIRNHTNNVGSRHYGAHR